LERLTRIDREESRRVEAGGAAPANAVRRRAAARSWAVGDRLRHASFGEGLVTHLFGGGERISIAVKFEAMPPKILDPRLAPIEPLES
jgi:DNA helicase-2/ATP-dependent DNA helicase PcrA